MNRINRYPLWIVAAVMLGIGSLVGGTLVGGSAMFASHGPEAVAAAAVPAVRETAPFSGAVVTDIVPGGPASKTGLQKDDVIVALNGRDIDGRSLRLAVGAMAPGTTIDLKVLRDGSERKFSITLDTMPRG
jgi:S1-C subfamily serine protease